MTIIPNYEAHINKIIIINYLWFIFPSSYSYKYKLEIIQI